MVVRLVVMLGLEIIWMVVIFFMIGMLLLILGV